MEDRVSGQPRSSYVADAPTTVNVRRVGRPRRELVDSAPFTSIYSAVAAREAWVLRSARSAHPSIGFHKGSTFRTLLALQGRSVSQSTISRWESGEMQIPRWVAGLYEETLGCRMGTLQAPISGLRRTLTRVATRPPPLLETPRDAIEPIQLLRKLTGPDHDGHDWFLFAALASRTPFLPLDDESWGRLVARLLDEMCRSVDLAFTLRLEALAVLATTKQALQHVVRAIGFLVMDPASQAVVDAISLLNFVPGDRGTTLVTKLMHHERVEIRKSATALAAIRLARGDVSRATMPAMEQAVDYVVTQATSADPWLINLVNQLPRRSPNVDALLKGLRATQAVHQARSTGELVPDDVAHLVTRRLAHRAASDSGSNEPLTPMTQRLLREALFNAHVERRHQSARLLTVPHWRGALARAVVHTIGDDNEAMVRSCLARLMTYVATPDVAPQLARAALELGDIRCECVVAIAHSGAELPAELPIQSWVTSTVDVSQRIQYMYAMGMTGHPAVGRIADDASHALRDYAVWWRARGGAVRDSAT